MEFIVVLYLYIPYTFVYIVCGTLAKSYYVKLKGLIIHVHVYVHDAPHPQVHVH